ncbi:MAG: hypothetical protein OXE52_12630 [Chloroflexi bacterium]|nr:hypothetical protein [Chloroflexota bacterium]
MFTAALMRQAGLLFCLSAPNLSASYAPSGSVPISSRGALEAACLMPQGLRKQPDPPRQLAYCPKKVFLCPQNGQSRTKFKHKSNQTCHSKLGGYAARRQSLACSLETTLVLSSILLPQTKTLPKFWGKCAQIYRTTTVENRRVASVRMWFWGSPILLVPSSDFRRTGVIILVQFFNGGMTRATETSYEKHSHR